MDKALGKYEEQVELAAEIERLSTESDKFKKEVESARQAVATFRGVAKVEKVARAAERTARAALARQERVRGRAQKALGRAESQAMKAKKALAQVRKLGPRGKCPTCYRRLGDSFEEIIAHLEAERAVTFAVCNEAQRRINEIDAGMDTTSRSIKEAVQQVREATQAAKEAARAKEKLEAAGDSYARSVRRLGEKRARFRTLAKVKYDEGKHRKLDEKYLRLSPIHDRVEALRQEVSRSISVKRELRATVRELRRLRRRIDAIERRRMALGFDLNAHAAAKRAHDSAQAADKSAAVAHSAGLGKLGRLAEAQRSLRDEIRHLEKLRQQIRKDEEAIRYLTRIESLLDEFRVDLINRVRPQIEEHASVLFEQVTDSRYPRVVLDNDYSVSIYDGMGTYPIRRFSGGEEDLVNLCLRIAISEVVAQRAGGDTSSLVVLDEIFGSQDVERRERILQALARLEATFQQIILITHMEDIHDRVPHVLRVTENPERDAEAVWM